jgi:hypothetical protein
VRETDLRVKALLSMQVVLSCVCMTETRGF